MGRSGQAGVEENSVVLFRGELPPSLVCYVEGGQLGAVNQAVGMRVVVDAVLAWIWATICRLWTGLAFGIFVGGNSSLNLRLSCGMCIYTWELTLILWPVD